MSFSMNIKLPDQDTHITLRQTYKLDYPLRSYILGSDAFQSEMENEFVNFMLMVDQHG